MAERQKRREWEAMMIGEWLAITFPDAPWESNVRLGTATPRLPDGHYTEEDLRYLGVWRRRIDAVVYLEDRLLLVEAAMRADPGKLAKLKLYERLIPQTPELAEWRRYPIQKVLLYTIEDPVLVTLAREEGILPIQFVPSFFDEWFASLRPRDKRVPAITI